LTARYTAQAKRLALLYALGDGVRAIGVEHLRAAAAVLAYCQESLQYVFGVDTYPDTVTQRIADIVREARGTYVPRAALWKGLSHTVTRKQIDTAIRKLYDDGVVDVREGALVPNGRPTLLYAWLGD
jgi:hypothetical protein